VAVGYPDLFSVYGTVANQSGRSLEAILLVMGVYLSLSLGISLAVNTYNRRVALRWRL
jgi:general L-amino acid transport system permease protein